MEQKRRDGSSPELEGKKMKKDSGEEGGSHCTVLYRLESMFAYITTFSPTKTLYIEYYHELHFILSS